MGEGTARGRGNAAGLRRLYGGIFNESPNRREPVKRYPQRVIINTHLWEPGEALTMHLSADVYLLTEGETHLGSSLRDPTCSGIILRSQDLV